LPLLIAILFFGPVELSQGGDDSPASLWELAICSFLGLRFIPAIQGEMLFSPNRSPASHISLTRRDVIIKGEGVKALNGPKNTSGHDGKST